MKNVFQKLMLFGMLLLFAAPQVFAQGVETSETNWPVVIIGAIIIVVEVIARSIDNPKVTGLVGLAVNLLKNISDYLNRGSSE